MDGITGEVIDEIKDTVLELICDFKDNIFTSSSDKGDLLVVEFFFKKKSAKEISDHIVKHVLPYKKNIENKKLSFFREKKNEIFSGLPKEKVEYFASLVEKPEKKGGMSDENKDIVWDYFNTLASLAEIYKKNK
jgi:hypothetical protein